MSLLADLKSSSRNYMKTTKEKLVHLNLDKCNKKSSGYLCLIVNKNLYGWIYWCRADVLHQ